jgi:hypothetical protein
VPCEAIDAALDRVPSLVVLRAELRRTAAAGAAFPPIAAQDDLELRGVPALSGGDHDRHGFLPLFDGEVQLGGQAAARAPEAVVVGLDGDTAGRLLLQVPLSALRRRGVWLVTARGGCVFGLAQADPGLPRVGWLQEPIPLGVQQPRAIFFERLRVFLDLIANRGNLSCDCVKCSDSRPELFRDKTLLMRLRVVEITVSAPPHTSLSCFSFPRSAESRRRFGL